MYSLNLPDFETKIIKEAGKIRIWDSIRKKYVVLTPEEWVRQHFINYMVVHLKYPKSLIRVESGLNMNSLHKRSDILVYDRLGKPWLLVECKAPESKLNQKSFNQAMIYDMALGVKFICVTNGLLHFCFKSVVEGEPIKFLEKLPAFEDKV